MTEQAEWWLSNIKLKKFCSHGAINGENVATNTVAVTDIEGKTQESAYFDCRLVKI